MVHRGFLKLKVSHGYLRGKKVTTQRSTPRCFGMARRWSQSLVILSPNLFMYQLFAQLRLSSEIQLFLYGNFLEKKSYRSKTGSRLGPHLDQSRFQITRKPINTWKTLISLSNFKRMVLRAQREMGAQIFGGFRFCLNILFFWTYFGLVFEDCK